MLFSLAATWTIVSFVNETLSLLATSASVNSYASISEISEPEFNGAEAVELAVKMSFSATSPTPDQSVSFVSAVLSAASVIALFAI